MGWKFKIPQKKKSGNSNFNFKVPKYDRNIVVLDEVTHTFHELDRYGEKVNEEDTVIYDENGNEISRYGAAGGNDLGNPLGDPPSHTVEEIASANQFYRTQRHQQEVRQSHLDMVKAGFE